MTELDKYPPIYVKWVDSFGCTSSWSEISEINSELTCHTIGFLISENDHSISVANSIAIETDHTLDQANGVMTIPKVSIISREKI